MREPEETGNNHFARIGVESILNRRELSWPFRSFVHVGAEMVHFITRDS